MAFRQIDSKLSSEYYPARRGQIVLSIIIEEYLMTGEPVGSKAVADKFASAAGWSSATIRNTMCELEEAGLLAHPHTSAGRLPTDAGYRYYVDNLLGILQISDDDLNLINKHFCASNYENNFTPERFLERTSQLLSNLSQNIGIVVSPSLAENKLEQIKFINLADKRVLVILVSASQLVYHKVIRLENALTQEELDRTARYLNFEFAGESLTVIRRKILALMHEEKTLFDKMLQTAMILCSESLQGEDDRSADVYVDGASNILTKSNFADFEELRELLRTIEEKTRLMQVLNECIRRDQNLQGGVKVVIGSENLTPSFQNCALITAPFHFGGNANAIGTLSVLGPTRIEYARVISLVSYLAKVFESLPTTAENKIPNRQN